MCGIWGLLTTDERMVSIQQDKAEEMFMKSKHRGPDKSSFIVNSNYIIGFHRLAIMDPTNHGDQPFSFSYTYTDDIEEGVTITRTINIICNGEIYNYKELKNDPELVEYCNKINYVYKSDSDCEILLPLYLKYGSKDIKIGIENMVTKLNGEFAFAIYDSEDNSSANNSTCKLYLGRDRFGIRPLFYTVYNNSFIFSSELKSLIDYNSRVEVFNPRSWALLSIKENEIMMYYKLYYYVAELSIEIKPNIDNVCNAIQRHLIQSVKIRLDADREIGCLLSGGLDSSLVAAIAAKELHTMGRKLKTFSIGMHNSPDAYNAKIVAEHIGSIHTNIEIPEIEWINSLEKIVEITETFDITTIRASAGQYLISKWIAENTDIKVLLIGDGADELAGGYLYFHNAPSPTDLHFECKRLLNYIHYFDVLRSDRGIASNGLEARVPFLDHKLVDLYFQIDPVLRMPTKHTLSDGTSKVYEKYLLRRAFENTKYLPECILWRRKEAFSDGISSEHKPWFKIIQEDIELKMSDEYFEENIKKYKNDKEQYVIPHTKEALYYHELFDKIYPNQNHICPYYWLPKWVGEVTDPSARVLNIY
jgi:asparagine synthase (glutamine-hydrolysing)